MFIGKVGQRESLVMKCCIQLYNTLKAARISFMTYFMNLLIKGLVSSSLVHHWDVNCEKLTYAFSVSAQCCLFIRGHGAKKRCKVV